MSNTPSYQGPGQAVAGMGGGWLGRIGSLLGVATPVYQPAPVAKIEGPSAETQASAQAAAACPVDADPFGSGPIAIIIPRQG